MKFINLAAAVICTFAALIGFDGSTMDAVNGALAVLNFGLFVSA